MGRPHAIPITDLQRRYRAQNLRLIDFLPPLEMLPDSLPFLKIPAGYKQSFTGRVSKFNPESHNRLSELLRILTQWYPISPISKRYRRIVTESQKKLMIRRRVLNKPKTVDKKCWWISSGTWMASLTSAKLQYPIDYVSLSINNEKLSCQIFALLHYHWNSYEWIMNE